MATFNEWGTSTGDGVLTPYETTAGVVTDATWFGNIVNAQAQPCPPSTYTTVGTWHELFAKYGGSPCVEVKPEPVQRRAIALGGLKA